MALYELTTCSFIVKIWIEETKNEAERTTWRGYISHVTSGKRRYIERLDEIAIFVIPYLEAMGVDFKST